MQILVIDIHALSIVRCDFQIVYMHAKTKLKQIYMSNLTFTLYQFSEF